MTGYTADSEDFTDTMKSHAPLVFAFVLLAAFILLLFTFRSIVIPFKAILLNLLSVGAAYGILVWIFQEGHLESVLGFESTGAIVSWMPIFLFVVLFGLSMDYHVFILTRIREAFDRGMPSDEAVAHGIKTTAGVVTSAAVVMIAVFAIFATLSLLIFKQLGVGLAMAVLIDATIIRGVLLPATMKLLGDWNWYLPELAGVAAPRHPRARAGAGRAGRGRGGPARAAGEAGGRRGLACRLAVVDAMAELERGREAYSAEAWADAYEALLAADQSDPLGAGDLELLASSAYMLGRENEYLGLLERAHRAHLDAGDPLRGPPLCFLDRRHPRQSRGCRSRQRLARPRPAAARSSRGTTTASSVATCCCRSSSSRRRAATSTGPPRPPARPRRSAIASVTRTCSRSPPTSRATS